MKYQVQICRVEHTLYYIEVEAKNEAEAERKGRKEYENNGGGEGDVVHAEEFIHDIEKV